MKRLLAGFAVVVGVALSTTPAYAAFALNITDTDGSFSVTIFDGGAGDTDGIVDGSISVAPTAAGQYTVLSVSANYQEVGGIIPTLNLNSIDIESNSVAGLPTNSLVITLSQDGITIPTGPELNITGSASGVWSLTGAGGDVYDYSAFADAGNVLFGTATPAGTCQQVSPATVGNTSTSCNAPDASFTRAGAYSLTNRITLDVNNTNTIANLTAATSVFNAAPEPGSMVLLGLGLVGTAAAVRRRRKSSAK